MAEKFEHDPALVLFHILQFRDFEKKRLTL